MVPGHLWIVWEREKLSFGSKGRKETRTVHVDEPLALVLTPSACQAAKATFWLVEPPLPLLLARPLPRKPLPLTLARLRESTSC